MTFQFQAVNNCPKLSLPYSIHANQQATSKPESIKFETQNSNQKGINQKLNPKPKIKSKMHKSCGAG